MKAQKPFSLICNFIKFCNRFLGKSRYQQSYDGLNYTVANYRFLLQQGRWRILEETDFTADGRRLTVVDGTDWQTVEAGSTEDIIRSIALRWLAGDGESR